MAAAFGMHNALADNLNGCPDGQAIQASDPSGKNVRCIAVPPPVDVSGLQAAITAEGAARATADAALLAAIDEERQARIAAIEALQAGQPGGALTCTGAHFVRNNGNELHFTALTFTNADLQNPATIERLTVRNSLGVVLSDTGPKTGTPHPLTRATVPPRDFTVVPPGATYTFSTTDLWGFDPIPGHEGTGVELISLQVEISKAGKPGLVGVRFREVTRDRFFTGTNFTIGNERSITSGQCNPSDPA